MLNTATFWTGWLPYVVVAVSILVGAFFTFVYTTINKTGSTFAWLGAGMCVIAVALIAGAANGEISFARAALVFTFGASALLASERIVQLIGQGEAIELQNHWGGIGAGLGGWRLSPVTSLMIFTLILAGAAIAIAVPGKVGSESGKPPTAQTEQQKSNASTSPEAGKPAECSVKNGNPPKSP